MPDQDRIKKELETFIRRALSSNLIRNIDYLASYPCKFVTQNSDGTLELQPEDSRLPPFKNVPIYYGIPGAVSAQLYTFPGQRVLLQFAGGDPQKPFASVWSTATVESITVAASSIHIQADDGSSIDVLDQQVNVGTGASVSVAVGNSSGGAVVNLGDPAASHPLIYGDDFSTPGGAFDTLIRAISIAVGTIPSGAGAASSILAALTAYQASVTSKLSPNVFTN